MLYHVGEETISIPAQDAGGPPMTTDAGQFADLVREVRSQLGISQENLARELGVSFATVNRWENGRTRPMKLARAQFDSFCARMQRRGKLDLD